MLLSYRFCVDDPYDDDQDMVNISRIFHSVLVGSIHSHHDYHTMETSQDYSVIITDITEDYQVFKQEITNNGDETDMIEDTNMIDEAALVYKTAMIDYTHSNSKTDKLDTEAETTEIKHTETEDIMQDDNILDHGKYLLDSYNSKTTSNLKTHIQCVHKDIQSPCPDFDYQLTSNENLIHTDFWADFLLQPNI